MHRAAGLTLALLAGLLAVGCDEDDGRELRPPVAQATTTAPTSGTGTGSAVVTGSPGGSATGLRLSLPFSAAIDPLYTCDGDGLAPQISWFDVPAGTRELALTVIDLDADGYVHWVIAGLDPSSGSYLPDAPGGAAIEAVNTAGEVGWAPACPTEGDGPHRYEFTLHAFDRPLEIAPDSPASDVIEAIEDGAIDRSALVVTYERP